MAQGFFVAKSGNIPDDVIALYFKEQGKKSTINEEDFLLGAYYAAFQSHSKLMG